MGWRELVTPAPTPLPSDIAHVLHETTGVSQHLDNLGASIGRAILHVHVNAGIPVAAMHGPHLAPVAAAGVLAACTLPGCVWCWKRRQYLRQSLRGTVSVKVWRERRRWHHQTKGENISGHPMPKVCAGNPTRSGVTLRLRLKDGMNLELLEKARPALGAALSCMDLTLERVIENQGQALMHVGRRDSLAEAQPWPWLDRETTNFLGPIPAGYDRNGKPVTIDLREHCALVGGTTGAGKSWWVHTVVAAAMLDLRVRVHILDGKWGTGFAVWEGAADSFASNDKDEMERAYQIVCRLEKRINRIYEAQRAAGKRTIDWATAESVDLLVLDEFTAFYGYKDIAKRLANLIARGRAAGLMMIFTTQRPSSKIVDTDFRELFHYRVAFWSDRNGSKMILGDGVEADSSEFSGMNPGEMYLLTQARATVRCRGYSLTDSDLATLAARATTLRSNHAAATGSEPNDEPSNDPASDPQTPGSAPFDNVALFPSNGRQSDLPGEAPSLPQETRKPLEGYQRQALALVNNLGPQVTVRDLAPHLPSPDGTVGVSERSAQRRIDWLEARGLVFSARRAHRPGEARGAADPKLWSLTPAGYDELSDATQPVPTQGGAQ